jgi:hypothetical protein
MKDEFNNHWQGPYKLQELKHLRNKSYVKVWFKGAPNCGWDTPHHKHSMSLADFLSNHPKITEGIWILRTNKHKYTIPIAIVAALITAFATIFTGIFNSSGTQNNNEINGNSNIIIQGEKNTFIINSEEWGLEDSKGEIDGDFVEVRIAYFKILTDKYRWKIGSCELLENDERMADVLPEYIDNLRESVFETALGLIAVGVASQENNHKRSIEEDRAEQRAENIQSVLNQHPIAKGKESYSLNLGVHKTIDESLNKNETSKQRRVIVIGVMNKSKNISLSKFEECLRDALKSSKVSFDINKYSKFDLISAQIEYMEIEYRIPSQVKQIRSVK